MKNLLAVCCLWALSFAAHAQNRYFVSTTGSNTNNGSYNNPWKTIQHGMNQLKPGDILNIIEGVYYEKLNLNVSGAKNQLITIKAYENDNVVVDGDNFDDSRALFRAYNKSFYRVEGIHFTNCYHEQGAGGFYIDGHGDTIQLINCKFSNVAIGRDPDKKITYYTNQPVVSFMGTNASKSIKNVLVTDIEIFDCRPGFSECLSISGNGEYFEFSNNYVHDNTNIAIDAIGNYGYCPDPKYDQARYGVIKNNVCHHNQSPYAAAAGIYIDGARDIVIENNILHHNNYGAEIGCEEAGSASNIIFRNNVVYKNKIAGIALGGYNEATGGKVINSKIINNTFYQNDTKSDGNGELFFSQFENGLICNNIFYVSNHNYLMSNFRKQPGLTMKYNLVYSKNGKNSIESYWNGRDLSGLSEIKSKVGMDNTTFFGNPQFNDLNNGNFEISSNSPAIDSGDPDYTPESNEIDINNEKRLHNRIVDCGSDEYHGTLSTTNTNTKLNIDVFPNPTQDKITINGNFKNHSIKVYNIQGQLIDSYNKASSPYSITLKHLESAIYFITVDNKNSKRIGNYKIVKK